MDRKRIVAKVVALEYEGNCCGTFATMAVCGCPVYKGMEKFMKFSKTFFIALLLTSFFSFSIARAEAGIEIEAINEEVLSLYDAGKYDDALPLAQKSLQLTERRFGPEHPDTVYSLYVLASIYKSQKDYATAKSLFQRFLSINEKTLGREHPLTLPVLDDLAELYYLQGDYAAAEPFYQRALSIKEKVLGKEHPDIAVSLGKLARVYLLQGDYATAKPLIQRALSISEKELGKEHPVTAGLREILLELEN